MRVIGLTGGIASGKSTVSQSLAALGAVIIDADLIARQVVEPGQPAFEEILNHFGPQVLAGDGTLDRKRLGAIVFADPEKLRLLNNITHPRILQRLRNEIGKARYNGVSVAVLDVALLFETGMDRLADEIWVVSVPEDIQVKRLMARDGISREEAERRIASQMPAAERLRRADIIIDNSGTPEETRAQVAKYYSDLLARMGNTHDSTKND